MNLPEEQRLFLIDVLEGITKDSPGSILRFSKGDTVVEAYLESVQKALNILLAGVEQPEAHATTPNDSSHPTHVWRMPEDCERVYARTVRRNKITLEETVVAKGFTYYASTRFDPKYEFFLPRLAQKA